MIDLSTPGKYCGRRLTEATKVYCIPIIKNYILENSKEETVVNKGGIIDSCCKVPCTKRTMIRFCPDHYKSNDSLNNALKKP